MITTYKILDLPLTELHPSPFNRERAKRYNKLELQRLADNLAEQGQIEPTIVRVRAEGGWEIVAGERRWHGMGLAGKDTLTCIVRELNDRQVCDLMLSENIHREDMNAVEEAAVYADMLKAKDAEGALIYPTLESLTQVVGKTSGVIKTRIKILNCPEFLLEALIDGRTSAKVCEIIGRIPDEADREKAARRALHCQFREGPMTRNEVFEMVRNEYMISLELSPFDQERDDLLGPVIEAGERVYGGSCVDCPARTGNMPELSSLLSEVVGGRGRSMGMKPNNCVRPSCYHEKCKRAWREEERQAESAGHRIVPNDVGLALLASLDVDLGVYKKGKELYVDRFEKPGHHHTGHFGNDQLPTWDELLSSEKVSWIMVREGRRRRYFLESEIAVATVDAIRAKAGEDSLFKRGAVKLEKPIAAPLRETKKDSVIPFASEQEVKRRMPKERVVNVETQAQGVIYDYPKMVAYLEQMQPMEERELLVNLLGYVVLHECDDAEVKSLIYRFYGVDEMCTPDALVDHVIKDQPARIILGYIDKMLKASAVVCGLAEFDEPVVEEDEGDDSGSVEGAESSEGDEGLNDEPPLRYEVHCEVCEEGIVDDAGICEICGHDHSSQDGLFDDDDDVE